MVVADKDILRIEGISKRFPGIKVLDDVTFSIRAGEVHALLGENGAGKSTLLKIISGIIQPDQGDIYIAGEKVRLKNSVDAAEKGVSMVFQERSCIPSLSIAENIFMAHEQKNAIGVFDRKTAIEQTRELLSRINVDLDPETLVEELSVAQVQMVSIARALSMNPKILLLDEPTSSLTDNEIKNLFSIVNKLKKENVGILYISHRMEEIFQLADRVTVLRDGKCMGTSDISATTADDLIAKMVGRTIENMYPKEVAPYGDEALRVEGLTRKNVCKEINFSVRCGEVLGMYGLVGAGRTEVARIVFGLDPKDTGDVYLFGEKVEHATPRDMIQKGMGYLTEDRKNEGLSLILPIRMDVLRAAWRKFFPSGVKNTKKEHAIVEDYVKKLSILTPSIEKLSGFLSGGTQQKVIIAHWMLTDPKILILDEPTKGIDVGTKVEIYKMMNDLAKEGVAILLISSDLPELINMSDRVVVMRNGEITGRLEKDECDAEKVISYAIGVET